MTASARHRHLAYAADVIERLSQIEGVESVAITDDNENLVMRLNHYGAWYMARIMRSHKCKPSHDDEQGVCGLLALAWYVEGCPDAGDDPHQSTLDHLQVVVPSPKEDQ